MKYGETQVDEALLEGRMCITKELVAFQTSDRKYQIGCKKGGAELIRVMFFLILNT